MKLSPCVRHTFRASASAGLLAVASQAWAGDTDLDLATGPIKSGIAITSLPFTVANRASTPAEFVTVECTFFDGDYPLGTGLALLDPIPAGSSASGEVIVARLPLARRASCTAKVVE
jgi:hypothetical protein